MTRALVVVDVQKEFCEGGSVPVGGGAERARAIAELIRLIQGPEREGWTRVVAGSDGTDFHPAFATAVEAGAVDEVFLNGDRSASQSGFEGFSEDGTPLADWLHDRGVDAVDIVGAAVDHCVRATALDAVRAGFSTRVLLDHTAGCTPRGMLAAISELGDAGVELTGTPVVAVAT
ncbi:isochorismatase family protein [Streptomyces sp. NRRL WC-3742]|uniref:isochorismatase family protein n=1 Tax=Streptomyces sp. NRRL WC-3742 TaxID=1463934 RepID=UPI0004C57277|nr:isochorismatase family protein [Streptomyces sp. NRRL WC-3742]